MNLRLEHILWKNHDIPTYPLFSLYIPFYKPNLDFSHAKLYNSLSMLMW